MKKLFTCCFIFLGLLGHSQTNESFDIASFIAPKNWKKEIKSDVVSYTITNQSNGGYCVIAVYKSIAGLGNIDKDYDKEWKELVVDRFTVNSTPETETEKRKDGWLLKAGAAAINDGNGAAIAILSVFENSGSIMSVLALTNKEEFITNTENFISSIKFKKIQGGLQEPTAPVATGNYKFTTSNFDDGWVSTVMNDYVLVEKEGNTVYLNYHVPYNASQFSGTGVRDAEYYWDTYVTKLFTVKSKQLNDGGSMALKPPYMKGYATDKRTGKPSFIGMYLVIVPNAASVVIGTALNETAFRKLYPKANDPFGSDLAAMTRYNKFAVAPGDIVGKWQNGNTSTAQWYYTSPSGYEGYAGMTLAATSATFNFNKDGTYTSIHNGATGAVGNMNTFQQEYKGKYTVSNWAVTFTNRYGGKTDRFDAYFEAVRGGRILKLNNGAGQDYNLVKHSTNTLPATSGNGTPSPSSTINADPKLFGKWNRSGASHPHYADPASWGTAGYTTSRYEFKKDGSYQFTERSFRMTYQHIIIVKENGTYTVNGNQLTIVPAKSIIQSYTKKNNVDELGSLVKSQNRTLEIVTYNYQFHYFSGIQEWNLVLQSSKPTQRDGNFSNNTTFSNAWYYDQKYTDTDLTSPKGK